MNFNINNMVQIRMTQSGHQDYADHLASLGAFSSAGLVDYHPEDENGWSTWQLWEVMSVFGPHIDHGVEPVFETTIIIPEAP